jgi:hypothetical protein
VGTFGYVQLVGDDVLRALRQDPYAVQVFCFECYARKDAGFVALDKFWAAIGFCVEQAVHGCKVAAGFLRFGGQIVDVFGDNVSVHGVRGWPHASVRILHGALASVDVAEVLRPLCDGSFGGDDAEVRRLLQYAVANREHLAESVRGVLRLLELGARGGKALLSWLE